MRKILLFSLFAACLQADSFLKAPVQITVGQALPSTCNVGDVFLDPQAATMKGCYAANTWGPLDVTLTAPISTISASASVAKPGDTVTITTDGAANFTLVGDGTLTVVDAHTAKYTPPAHVPAQSTYAGYLTSPNDSVFNTRIDSLPVHASSAQWITNGTTLTLGSESGWGVSFADASTPQRAMTFNYTPQYSDSFPAVPCPNDREHGSCNAYGSADHHTITLRTDTGEFSETYQATPDNTFYACGSRQCNAQSGVKYTGLSNKFLGVATDAAGLPLLPLTLTANDIHNGVNHALRFVMSTGYLNTKGIWPSGSMVNGDPSRAPYGARFRLKSTYTYTGTNPLVANIVNGLKQYGMFLADATTGQFVFSTSHDVNLDPAALNAVKQLAGLGIHFSDFEAVDESSLMVSPDSYAVSAPTVPAASKIVATDTFGHTLSTSVQLQPILVGVDYSHIQIASGVTVPLHYRITGTSNQAATCTLLSGGGTLTGCTYTAPVVSATTEGSIQITSAADPSASTIQYFSILPLANGTLRVDSGAGGDTKDANGNVWAADTSTLTGIRVAQGSDYPNWTLDAAHTPFRSQYQSYVYTYGDDLAYRYFLPNGNYKVHLLFGVPHNGCASNCTINHAWHNNIDVMASNGSSLQTGLHRFDYGAATNWQVGYASDAYVPMTVTNGEARLVLMSQNQTFATNNNPSPIISGFEFIPDNSAPYLTIDADQQKTSIAVSSKLQLYAVGWYMPNTVSWTASDGSIDSTGLFTAPATAEDVTITATSTVNPSVQATFTVHVQ